ncbi:YitT family protein [Irregularibacter muris]|uniref:YitT family protein n=1 Tax=Irregularibacter muris TaxID=1796619 RepID=A0AAE3HJ50_9FIRM|nr:YitT family protein [Irregularibacter muris]MCR1900305.1 YitT family protein [Irregularibacter muris]
MGKKITLDARRISIVLLGCLLLAIGINGFLVPHHLLSGGVTGLSILLNYITGLPVGLMIFLLNIPVFVLGYKLVSRPFIIISLIGTVSLSLFVTWTTRLPVFVDDVLLSAVFGGVITGLGSGIVFANRGTTGGTDIIAVIIKKYFSVDVGTTMFTVNATIVLFSSLVFGVRLGLYTLISIYINSLMIDKVQQGLDRKKAILVITEKPEEARQAIINQIKRGVTLLEGQGGYTQESKKIVFCLVTPFQLAKIREILLDIDEGAFITVLDAAEVVGKGFKNRD